VFGLNNLTCHQTQANPTAKPISWPLGRMLALGPLGSGQTDRTRPAVPSEPVATATAQFVEPVASRLGLAGLVLVSNRGCSGASGIAVFMRRAMAPRLTVLYKLHTTGIESVQLGAGFHGPYSWSTIRSSEEAFPRQNVGLPSLESFLSLIPKSPRALFCQQE
jgi:hypothetical protein